jgi:hypothetical protein
MQQNNNNLLSHTLGVLQIANFKRTRLSVINQVIKVKRPYMLIKINVPFRALGLTYYIFLIMDPPTFHFRNQERKNVSYLQF